jgi:hypothetical protein
VPTLIPIAAAPAIPPPRARFKDLSKISFVVGIGFGGGVVAASVAMAAAVAGCLKLDAQALHAQALCFQNAHTQGGKWVYFFSHSSTADLTCPSQVVSDEVCTTY